MDIGHESTLLMNSQDKCHDNALDVTHIFTGAYMIPGPEYHCNYILINRIFHLSASRYGLVVSSI